MRIPDSLASLADYGIIDQVLRPLMSGKEAQIYLVISGGEYRVAKVFKEAQNRTFKNRAEYTEGRKVRNSRDQRAMGKSSRHGRAQAEAAWRNTEVDMIYRLRDAGVRVPTPYHFIDGVLVMELIGDERGEPAPRLGDVVLRREDAQHVFDRLLAEVVRMLAAGVVHGDLSDFNVLMAPDGPVIIDFPQAVDASSNRNARKLLLRDVANLHRFMARFAPDYAERPFAQEMWALYERGELTPEAKLTGRYRPDERKVSTEAVLGLIGDAARDERRRREQLGLSMRGASAAGGSGEDSSMTSAPRALSRYAQKRQAQVAAAAAAREAEQLAATQRATQHKARGAASQQAQPRAHDQSRRSHVAGQRPRHDRQAPSRDTQAQHARHDRQAPSRDAQAQHARHDRQAPSRDTQAQHARHDKQASTRDAQAQHARHDRQAPSRDAQAQHARHDKQAPTRDAQAQRERHDKQAPTRDAQPQQARQGTRR